MSTAHGLGTVHRQVKRQPEELFSTTAQRATGRGTTGCEEERMERFLPLWQEVARYMTTNKAASIDDILRPLGDQGIIESKANPESFLTSKSLVFAVIGWQTMLYQPDMHACSASQLAIESQMGLHQGPAHLSLKQAQSSCRKPMHEFLLGSGIFLPPRNYSIQDAYFLSSNAGINIEWTDSLPCHLEFDPNANTLFIFRYPSFCLANLRTSASPEKLSKSIIHPCAAPCPSSRPWATEEEVTRTLQETILSYRLLFGQNKASRQLFRSLSPFNDIPAEGRDRLLSSLCTQKAFHLQTPLQLLKRDSYNLRRDFPILRSRLTILMSRLSSRKPRTWKELWLDKRDSALWLTFWAVLIIGGSGILLALLQVVLQIVQIVKT
ncbi:hypothetical protein DL98DRAFT_609117 [Cadophora sp. DSE1049]|nr:hypothetical protein DL98DRAFT_609117 [Cadophora sp. DSE1049]